MRIAPGSQGTISQHTRRYISETSEHIVSTQFRSSEAGGVLMNGPSPSTPASCGVAGLSDASAQGVSSLCTPSTSQIPAYCSPPVIVPPNIYSNYAVSFIRNILNVKLTFRLAIRRCILLIGGSRWRVTRCSTKVFCSFLIRDT